MKGALRSTKIVTLNRRGQVRALCAVLMFTIVGSPQIIASAESKGEKSVFTIHNESEVISDNGFQLAANGSKLLVGSFPTVGDSFHTSGENIRLINTRTKRSQFVSRDTKVRLPDGSFQKFDTEIRYALAPQGDYALLHGLPILGAQADTDLSPCGTLRRQFNTMSDRCVLLVNLTNSNDVRLLAPLEILQEVGPYITWFSIESLRFSADGKSIFYVAQYIYYQEFASILSIGVFRYDIASAETTKLTDNARTPQLNYPIVSIDFISKNNRYALITDSRNTTEGPKATIDLLNLESGEMTRVVQLSHELNKPGFWEAYGLWVDDEGQNVTYFQTPNSEAEAASRQFAQVRRVNVATGTSTVLDCAEMFGRYEDHAVITQDGKMIYFSSEPDVIDREGNPQNQSIYYLNTQNRRCGVVAAARGSFDHTSPIVTPDGAYLAYLKALRAGGSDDAVWRRIILKKLD